MNPYSVDPTTKESRSLTESAIDLAVACVSIFTSGLLFFYYWQWFIQPIFLVKSISIAQSLGLMIFIKVFTVTPSPFIKNTPLYTFETFLRILSIYSFFWLIGWGLHQIG